jgi:hypothetical protein
MRSVSVAMVLFVAGCTSSRFVATNAAPHPMKARPVAEVAVYTTTAPEKAYVEVGIVTAKANTNPPVGRDELIQSVREEAAARGCDGLILGSGSTLFAEGTCIVFK